MSGQAEVDIWTVSLTTPAPEHLSDDEVARAKRFKFEQDRIRWIRARSSLRLILSRYVNEHPGAIEFLYGPHGKPALPPVCDVQFNLSHAGDYALVAVTDKVPVGVDIEHVRPNIEMAALLRRLGETDLPNSTEDLYQRWTRREARSKAAGGGLFDTPQRDAYPIDINAPEGYAASVALIGCEPVPRYCAGKR
jgi:4'-phosphopantetheinyl transferase